MDQIKHKLRDTGIFDWSQPFNDREKKELNKLFDAVEIMVNILILHILVSTTKAD